MFVSVQTGSAPTLSYCKAMLFGIDAACHLVSTCWNEKPQLKKKEKKKKAFWGCQIGYAGAPCRRLQATCSWFRFEPLPVTLCSLTLLSCFTPLSTDVEALIHSHRGQRFMLLNWVLIKKQDVLKKRGAKVLKRRLASKCQYVWAEDSFPTFTPFQSILNSFWLRENRAFLDHVRLWSLFAWFPGSCLGP